MSASTTARRSGVIDHLEPRHQAGRKDRPRRPFGRRQVDHRQPAAALLRPRERADHRSTARTSPRVQQDSLREQIGVVTQDTSLLHRSVRENILYGRPDASEEEMLAAAKLAEADDFVARAGRSQGPHRLRRPCRRARREALGWPAPAHRHRSCAAQERPDPRARRGHLGARQRGRGGDPGPADPARWRARP